MPRTTLNIDAPVLENLKSLRAKENKSLGKLVSMLLVEALAMHKARRRSRPKLEWQSREMGAPRVEIEDKQAVWALLDAETHHD